MYWLFRGSFSKTVVLLWVLIWYDTKVLIQWCRNEIPDNLFVTHFFFQISLKESVCILIRSSWSLFTKAPLTTSHLHWVIWSFVFLTHWGRVTHICVCNLTIIGSDNGLSPGRRQAIIWTSAGILLIGTLGTNFSEISIGVPTFHSRKFTWKCRLRNGVHFVPASMC